MKAVAFEYTRRILSRFRFEQPVRAFESDRLPGEGARAQACARADNLGAREEKEVA